VIDYLGFMIPGMCSGAVRRPVRAALLFALLLLVGCHLVGALHGPGFATLSAQAVVDGCSHAAERSADRAPGHGDGHADVVDHTVDRLRAPAGRAIADPSDTAPLTYAPRAVPGPSDLAGPEPVRGDPAGGRATLTRICVLRR
jgi:hypothetical protein